MSTDVNDDDNDDDDNTDDDDTDRDSGNGNSGDEPWFWSKLTNKRGRQNLVAKS